MKNPDGCKLFGAQQALSGIRDGVILFHSVIGCNFGTMTYHVCPDQRDIRQTCTVINDSDIIFGGEDSLRKAIQNAVELFHPKVLFVVGGCVCEMIGDHVQAVIRELQGDIPIVYVEAAGFRGDVRRGYEAACQALVPYLKANPEKKPNKVNLLGLGGDDYRKQADILALKRLLGDGIGLQTVFSACTWEEFRSASEASCNLVLDDRAMPLARAMEEAFGIPYEQLDYPYGVSGMKAVQRSLRKYFPEVPEGEDMEKEAVERVSRVYSYLQSLYGLPAAVIGSGGRARGMRRFLEQEIGMEVVAFAVRDALSDVEEFYDQVRRSEAALIFGSSFELDLAEELGISLIRYDWPVFDELCLTDAPYLGSEGIAPLVESILNTVMKNPARKGALYQ